MSNKAKSGGIEKKAVRTIRRDGLETIGLGIFLAVLAIFIYDIRYGGITGLGVLGFILLPPFLRKYITYPRVGYAKFIEKNDPRAVIASIAIVILCLILFYLIGSNEKYGFLMPLFLGILFALFIFWLAYRTGMAINYILGILYLAAGNIGVCFTLYGIDPGLVTSSMLFLLALITIIVGSAQTAWFMRKNPRVAGETDG